MFKAEEKFVDFITKNSGIILFVIASIIAIIIRINGRDFISNDMGACLIVWYKNFYKNGGVKALSTTIGDQNILYQTVICLLSYLKFNAIYLIKSFSIAFDWILAAGFAECVRTIKNKENPDNEWFICYAIILLLPTVVLNSAYWGQCDSIYTSFLVLTVLFLFREKFIPAFIFYGVALSFKLQSILMLPFLICYYMYKKKFNFSMFLIPIFVFWCSGILAYINGQNLLEVFTIYIRQTNHYYKMFMNFPNIWALAGNNYSILKVFAIMLTLALCLAGIYAVIKGIKKFETNEQVLNTCCWFLWTCLIFLPAMHDRYAYPLDIFLLLLCFMNKKYIKYSLICILSSMIVYGNYLYANRIPCSIIAVFYIFAYIHYTYSILENKTECKNSNY